MTLRFLALCAGMGLALAQTPNPPAPGGQRVPGPTMPGGPGGPGLEGQALRTYLNLSDTQMREMRRAGEQARRQAEEKAKAAEPQIREKRAALEGLMAKGGDAASVGKLMLEIRALEKQVHDAHRSARDSFVNSLSGEQKARFKAVEDAALLPQAAREAVLMGLVPGAEPRMQPPMPRRQMGQGPNRDQRRGMQGPQGPGQGPGQPQPPSPPRD